MVSEVEFIQTYLKPLCNSKGSLSLEDDAAILPNLTGFDTIISKDMLISGQHFFATDKAQDIAHKALAVNLSDIAAKGAKPHSFLLGIAFPKAPDELWAKQFISGLQFMMKEFDCELLGGDTTGTKGPLVISVTIFGQVETGKMVKRSGAKPGDKIFVSGTLGDAALGLQIREKNEASQQWQLSNTEASFLLNRYLKPEPRNGLASALKSNASSAMDISDGLTSDLSKLCSASTCGAKINLDTIPFSEPALKIFHQDTSLKNHCLSWGDDYEILTTIPDKNVKSFLEAANKTGISVTEIGEVIAQKNGITYQNNNGEEITLEGQIFSHF